MVVVGVVGVVVVPVVVGGGSRRRRAGSWSPAGALGRTVGSDWVCVRPVTGGLAATVVGSVGVVVVAVVVVVSVVVVLVALALVAFAVLPAPVLASLVPRPCRATEERGSA